MVLGAVLLIVEKRTAVVPGSEAGAPPSFLPEQVFERAAQTSMPVPEPSPDVVLQAPVPAVETARDLMVPQWRAGSKPETDEVTFAGCDCFAHRLRVRFVGVDARVILEGELGIRVSMSRDESIHMLQANFLTGPQDPVFEVDALPGVPVRVEIHAWDSNEPIWTTVLKKEPPCRVHRLAAESRTEPADLDIDLTPFLHVREVRLLDGAGQPIVAREAVFRASSRSKHPFTLADGHMLLVFSATNTEVHGQLEASGFRDRDLSFVADAGRFTEEVELQPGFEVEFQVKDLRFLGGERVSGLFVQSTKKGFLDSKAIMTLGSDVRGESQDFFFYFDNHGIVRLRLPHAGEFAARPIVGQRAGSRIKLIESSDDGRLFTVEARDGGSQSVVLDASAWSGLGE